MFGLKLILRCRTFSAFGGHRGLLPSLKRELSSSSSKLSPYDMPPDVVGYWKDYNIRLATMSDYEQIAFHVRTNFLKFNEINSKYLPFEAEDEKDQNELVKIAIGHRLSFVMDKRDEFDIAGVNLIMDNQQPNYGFKDFKPKSESVQIVFALFDALEKATEEKLHTNFKTERVAEIFLSSADVKLKGEGITQELYKRTLIFLKARGFQTVKGAFTSEIGKMVATRLGFQEIGRMLYRDHRDQYGNKYFYQAVDEGCVIAMALAL